MAKPRFNHPIEPMDLANMRQNGREVARRAVSSVLARSMDGLTHPSKKISLCEPVHFGISKYPIEQAGAPSTLVSWRVS